MAKVTIYRTTFTEYGDADTSEEVEEYDSGEEETPVEWAARLISDAGLTATSSHPWHPGDWYCDPDGSTVVDYGTGEREDASAHLDGFTVEEETAIYRLVSS